MLYLVTLLPESSGDLACPSMPTFGWMAKETEMVCVCVGP